MTMIRKSSNQLVGNYKKWTKNTLLGVIAKTKFCCTVLQIYLFKQLNIPILHSLRISINNIK